MYPPCAGFSHFKTFLLEHILVIFLFLQAISKTLAVRMIMLDVPSPVILGESVQMTCSYDMEQDKLYSIKWYRNDIEFYRYVPNDWPPGQYMPLPGINIDLTRSGKDSIYLKHVDVHSSGFYRCEVSADAPSFRTVNAKRDMQVFVLPTEGPKITGGRSKYQVGDTVVVNCSSVQSKPAATLRWFINDELAGPEYEKEYSTTLHANGLETSTLTLKFVAKDKHFREGNMRLKCTATISRVYTMSNEELVLGVRQQSSGLHIESYPEEVREGGNSGCRELSSVVLLLALLLVSIWTLR